MVGSEKRPGKIPGLFCFERTSFLDDLPGLRESGRSQPL
jgi:hypothetical protein